VTYFSIITFLNNKNVLSYMPTIQVSDDIFGVLKGLRKETPDKERKFEPYNSVLERLLVETGNLKAVKANE